MPAPDRTRWLTIGEAAREIGVDQKTLAKAINLKQAPGYRVGSLYRIPTAAWELFRANQWMPPAEMVKPTSIEEVKQRRVAS